MELAQEHKRRIEQIMEQMHCPKDFECYKSGFEKLCKVTDRGMKGYVDCLDKENRRLCEFKIPFGHGYVFCRCPVRVYVAKKLKK